MLGWNQRGVNWLQITLALVITRGSVYYCLAIRCNLYLAQSTIPNAGLGIFSGIELHAGDSVGHGDVSIPIFNFTPDEIYDYIWAGEVMGMKLEAGPDLIDANCPVSVVEWVKNPTMPTV